MKQELLKKKKEKKTKTKNIKIKLATDEVCKVGEVDQLTNAE